VEKREGLIQSVEKMAALFQAHKEDSGQLFVVNLDHVIFAESHPSGGGTLLTLRDNHTLIIKEPLDFLHAKTAP
jgi:hypothetical protein